MAATEATKLVRLKRHDPRRRHVLRSYMHGPSGKRFEEKRGWYVVPGELAAKLAKVRQIESEDESPLAFDICTLAEAKAIDAREKVITERRAAAADANDLTSSDVADGRRRAADVAGEVAPEEKTVAAPLRRAPASRIPKGQRGIRRGVRDPRERSMRPAEDEIA